MKKLAISIPNYNRISNLKELMSVIIGQIVNSQLYEDVQICVCDDCSLEDPTTIVEEYIKAYPFVDIQYYRKEKNQGMSRNFLDCVMMADSEYCWIIGNDDIPEEESIYKIIGLLSDENGFDFIVTPFDVYQNNKYLNTVYPIKNGSTKLYDTSNKEEYRRLCFDIVHNSGIFGFLSNIIFNRKIWEERKDVFRDKLNTLFIQMYINISVLKEGALYFNSDLKIIRNYLDDKTNNTQERIAGVLFGLDEIVEYFFEGDVKAHFKSILTDPFINGVLWEGKGNYRDRIETIESPKNDLYRSYFVSPSYRKSLFNRDIIIFGCGEYGYKAYNEAINSNANVIAVMDSDADKVGNKFGNLCISSIENIREYYDDNSTTVIIANHHHLVDMVNKVRQYGVKEIAIIT